MSIKAVNAAIDQLYYCELALKNLLRGLDSGSRDHVTVLGQLRYIEDAQEKLRELSKRMVDEAWVGPAVGSE